MARASKLPIDGLFQKGRILAQEGIQAALSKVQTDDPLSVRVF